MADVFEPIITRFISLGFLNALMLFFFSAILYAILRKSKIFGESVIINGFIAFIAAFLVFVFPFVTGLSLTTNFSLFFTQSAVILLFLVMSFIMASLFYPDMPKFLAEHFTHRSTLSVMIALGIALFIMSGLVSTLLATFTAPKLAGTSGVGASPDILIIGAGLIIFVVILIVAASQSKGD
jgi:MFS family permease